MISPAILKNALLFLGRAQATGQECIAWCEVVQAIQAELDAPAPPIQGELDVG
jgi:hypothetical protein